MSYNLLKNLFLLSMLIIFGLIAYIQKLCREYEEPHSFSCRWNTSDPFVKRMKKYCEINYPHNCKDFITQCVNEKIKETAFSEAKAFDESSGRDSVSLYLFIRNPYGRYDSASAFDPEGLIVSEYHPKR